MLDEDMFPTLKSVFHVALKIPVSSALHHLHTWLRSTMGQDRLNDLVIMSMDNQ